MEYIEYMKSSKYISDAVFYAMHTIIDRAVRNDVSSLIYLDVQHNINVPIHNAVYTPIGGAINAASKDMFGNS